MHFVVHAACTNVSQLFDFSQMVSLQPQYGMSAALSAAMFVTASTALPRSEPFPSGSNFKSKEIPTFNTIGKLKNSMHQRRSITVIDEVSA